jgi:hypothetical protein
MHYKNGREAKNGDKVILLGTDFRPPVAGILYDAVAGNNDCNGKIAITSANDPCPDLKECLHADDVARATIPDSKAPAAKAPAAEAPAAEAPAAEAPAAEAPAAKAPADAPGEASPIKGYVPNAAEARANATHAAAQKAATK